MHRDEQIIYAVLCVAGIVFYVFIIPAQIQDSEIATVSPRLVPQLCTILIVVLSLYKLLSTWVLARPGYLLSLGNYRRLATALAIPTAGAFIMQWTGFWIAAGLIVAGCMTYTGIRNPLRIGLFAIILTVVTWYLLDRAGLYIR